MKEQFLAITKRAHETTRTISVTFKSDAPRSSVNQLLQEDGVSIKLNAQEKAGLESVYRDGTWHRDDMRMVIVRMTDCFNPQTFVDTLGDAFENVRIASFA